MIFRVRIVPQAQRDLEDILHFIAADNVERAFSFVDELRLKIESLSTRPERFQKFGPFHRLVHQGYVVIYDVDRSSMDVNVLMVVEGHRDWQSVLRGWNKS